MLVSPDLQTVDDGGHQPAAVCVQVFLVATHHDQQQVLSNKELGNECMGTSLKIGCFQSAISCCGWLQRIVNTKLDTNFYMGGGGGCTLLLLLLWWSCWPLHLKEGRFMFHMAPTPGRCSSRFIATLWTSANPKNQNPSSCCYRSKSYEKEKNQKMHTLPSNPSTIHNSKRRGASPSPSHQVKSSEQNDISPMQLLQRIRVNGTLVGCAQYVPTQ